MGGGFDKSFFTCNGNNNNNIFQKCDTYIGYGTKGGLYAIRVFSIISLVLRISSRECPWS